MSEAVALVSADSSMSEPDERIVGELVLEPVTDEELRLICAGFPGTVGGGIVPV